MLMAVKTAFASPPAVACGPVTGGFRSNWGADLFAALRSVVGTASRHGSDAYHAIQTVLAGASIERRESMFRPAVSQSRFRTVSKNYEIPHVSRRNACEA